MKPKAKDKVQPIHAAACQCGRCPALVTSDDGWRNMVIQAREARDKADLEVERLKKIVTLLATALRAERDRTPCADNCGGGGWPNCYGCDQRLKAALAEVRT